MEEIRKKKEILENEIKKKINEFLTEYSLEFSGINYEIDWVDTPTVASIRIKVVI